MRFPTSTLAVGMVAYSATTGELSTPTLTSTSTSKFTIPPLNDLPSSLRPNLGPYWHVPNVEPPVHEPTTVGNFKTMPSFSDFHPDPTGPGPAIPTTMVTVIASFAKPDISMITREEGEVEPDKGDTDKDVDLIVLQNKKEVLDPDCVKDSGGIWCKLTHQGCPEKCWTDKLKKPCWLLGVEAFCPCPPAGCHAPTRLR